MLGIPPVGNWGKHVQLKVMKLRGIEPVFHSIGTDCNRRRIYIEDILEGQVQLQSQHITGGRKLSYRDKKISISSSGEKITNKEAVQLLWHSFRLSQGDMRLQFTMLYIAHQKYGSQDFDQAKLEEEFRKMIGVTKPTSKTSEYSIVKQRMKLSDNYSHDEVYASTVEESSFNSPFFSMFVNGTGSTTRSAGRDGTNYIGMDTNYLMKGKCIENIFESDFKYLLTTQETNGRTQQPFGFTFDEMFPGRPNRDSCFDGSNTIKDRYLSYFIWYIIKGNSTGNEFFNEYFGELHSFFQEWFKGLPTDAELDELNKIGWETKPFYNSLSSHRKNYNNSYSSRYFRKITKEDVLMLIAQYNATHPDTQIEMCELGLSEEPKIDIEALKEQLMEKDS